MNMQTINDIVYDSIHSINYLKETSIRAICMHCGKRFYHYDKDIIAPQYFMSIDKVKCCESPTTILNIEEADKIFRINKP